MNKKLNFYRVKIFFLFSLLCTSEASLSQDKSSALLKIQGSKDLPIELNYILDSFQINSDEDNQHFKKILPIIYKIDSYAHFISKNDLFFIGKIEIYKALLKTSEISPRAFIDGDSLKTLQSTIKTTTDPFIKWFLQALLQDCQNLMAKSAFKEYLLQKNAGALDKIELKKIDKKVQLLYRWLLIINMNPTNTQEALRNELQEITVNCLKNIEESLFLLARSAKQDGPLTLVNKPEDLKYFSIKEIKNEQKVVKKSKTVNDILAPLTDPPQETTPTLPGPSLEDWTQEENTPPALKNLPKPSNDADWLQDF
jgi:hypothetical protein